MSYAGALRYMNLKLRDVIFMRHCCVYQVPAKVVSQRCDFILLFKITAHWMRGGKEGERQIREG